MGHAPQTRWATETDDLATNGWRTPRRRIPRILVTSPPRTSIAIDDCTSVRSRPDGFGREEGGLLVFRLPLVGGQLT